jgi:hypothetical protein
MTLLGTSIEGETKGRVSRNLGYNPNYRYGGPCERYRSSIYRSSRTLYDQSYKQTIQ